MFSKSFALVFAAAAALSVSALDIDTPEKLTQCDTVEIKWSGKKAPFVLSVLPSCESGSEDPLFEIPGLNATSYKWTVNLPSSTGAIAFAITDNEGNEAYTDDVTIQSGDAACLNAASSSAASSVASTASASVSVSATPAAASASGSRTTLVVSATPSAPVNAGAGSSGSTGSGSGSSGSSGTAEANGAIAPVASAFAGMIGVATALLVLL